MGKPKIGGEKNIISLLYTSYFKVLSMTDQKQVLFLVLALNNKIRSALFKLAGVKTALFGESVM